MCKRDVKIKCQYILASLALHMTHCVNTSMHVRKITFISLIIMDKKYIYLQWPPSKVPKWFWKKKLNKFFYLSCDVFWNRAKVTGWMDELGFYVSFNSISVISRRWNSEHERLCAMKLRLDSGTISPPAGFELSTPWSEVRSAKYSATRTLPKVNKCCSLKGVCQYRLYSQRNRKGGYLVINKG